MQAATTGRRLGIPFVAANQVTLVSESRICAKAAQAYALELASSDSVTPSGRVYVAQVGTVYVVYDPVEHLGHYWLCVVMDSTYHVLARFMG